MHRRLLARSEPDADRRGRPTACLRLTGSRPRTAGSSIEDYIDVVDRAVEHCGGRVNLIGDCQGWLATIYALAPERVNTLTIAGAPRSTSRGRTRDRRGAAVVGAQRGPELLRGAHPAQAAASSRAAGLLSGFIAQSSRGPRSRARLELLCHLSDAKHVARYEFEDWFKHAGHPGAWSICGSSGACSPTTR